MPGPRPGRRGRVLSAQGWRRYVLPQDGRRRAAKDREQAAFLIAAMAEDRPDDLLRAYATAMTIGPRCREHIANTLKRMPDTMSILNGL